MNTRPVFFDEFSLYNRYRAGYATGDKVRGFFHLLRFRASADEAGQDMKVVPRRRRPAARDGPREFAPLRLGARGHATCPIILRYQRSGSAITAPADYDAQVEVVPTEGEDDEFLVLVSGLKRSDADCDCRILLMSAETVERLREAVPNGSLEGVPERDDTALVTLFKKVLQDDLLEKNELLARRLSAVADIDAQVDDRGMIEARVEIPKGSPALNEDCRVVIVIDGPQDAS